MYCPICGTTNHDEVRYCTRCGTNVGLVTEALSGKFDVPVETDERVVKLLKDFYRGRQMTVIGFILTVLMIFKLALSSFMGIVEDFRFLTAILTFFLGLGLIGLIWGGIKWSNASSELKARGYDDLKSARPRKRRAPESLPASPEAMRVNRYSTGSINEPASVTEETTRQLENRQPIPTLEKQSKPSN